MSIDSSKWREMGGRLLAEFAIVVLGVTIALWADGWVAERGARAQERARLVALSDNIEKTITELRDERASASEAVDGMRRLIAASNEGSAPGDIREQLRFALQFGADFVPELNVYDDLKNSGELALLTSAELRQSLATMDAMLSQLEAWQADQAAVQQVNIDLYFVENVDLVWLYGEDFGLESSEQDSDFSFLSSNEFRSRILLKLDIVNQLALEFGQAEQLLADVQRTIDAILRED